MRSRDLGAIDVPVDDGAYRHNVESIDELSDKQRDRTFRTNIHTYYYMASAAIAPMRRGSTISTTGSIAGLEGSKDLEGSMGTSLDRGISRAGKVPSPEHRRGPRLAPDWSVGRNDRGR